MRSRRHQPGGGFRVPSGDDFLPLSNALVHGLRIENNAALNNLTGITFHVGAGDIVISGNPALSQC